MKWDQAPPSYDNLAMEQRYPGFEGNITGGQITDNSQYSQPTPVTNGQPSDTNG